MSPLLPFDPDFDKPILQQVNFEHLLNVLGAKRAFMVGIVSALLVICAVGFFVLLTMFLRGGAPRI